MTYRLLSYSLFAFCLIAVFIFFYEETPFLFSSFLSSPFINALKIFYLCVISFILKRLIHLALVSPTSPKKISPLVLHILDFFLLTGTFLTIAVLVFHQNISQVLTAGSIISASIAFALKNIILDGFSGFVLDTDHHFRPGDWITNKDMRLIGEVIKINWRLTIIRSEDGVLFYMPNGDLVSKGYVQYPSFFQEHLDISVHHSVPFSRVRRLCEGALLTLPYFKDYPCVVQANRWDKDQIIYDLKYVVSDYGQRKTTRDAVLQRLLEWSQLYNLRDKPQEARDVILALLQHIDLFQALDDAESQVLVENLVIETYTQGQVIVQQGDQQDSMYIIAEGATEIYAHATTPNQQETQDKAGSEGQVSEAIFLAVLGMGQFFGDIALLTGRPRTATVRALTDVVVYRLDKQHFQPLLENNPSLAERFSHIIADRLEATDKSIQQHQATSKPDLAAQLLNEIRTFFGLGKG